MKKLLSVCSLTGLLAVGLLMLAGCENPAADSSGSKGVVGVINGVVYDTVTLKPVDGVNVQIGSKKAKTDKSGSFTIKDVGIGGQILSFQKDGYRFTTRNVYVDPSQYKNDDPFKEVQALEDQLTALKAYWEKKKYPDYVASVGDANSWTYQDGVWVNGDGVKVTVNQNEGEFVVEEIKLNYTYEVALPTYVTGLTPLNGALTGSVKLFKATHSELLSIELGDAVNIDKDINLWFKDTTNHTVGYEGHKVEILEDTDDDGVGDTPYSPPKYKYQDDVMLEPGSLDPKEGMAFFGPFKTVDGKFSITGVPADTPLELWFNGFSKDGLFYKSNSTVYQWDSTTSALIAATNIKANPHSIEKSSKKQIYTDVGALYIFAEGNFTGVSKIEGGTSKNPLKGTDAIVVTFADDISPSGFEATLFIGETLADSNATAFEGVRTTATTGLPAGQTDVGYLPLNVTWTNAKTASLKPLLGLLYSTDGALPVGRLQIKGKSATGADIYTSSVFSYTTNGPTTGLPVYTEEGVKLITVDLDPTETDIPGRAITNAAAIKLEFNKKISKASLFRWSNAAGNDSPADWRYGSDETIVYVYTDELRNNSSLSLFYSAVSAADAADVSSALTSIASLQKGPIEEQELALESTNLYDGKAADVSYFNVAAPTGTADGTFGIGTTGQSGDIVLNFTSDIPEGAVINVYLSRTHAGALPPAVPGLSPIAVSFTASGKTLTIKPNTRFELATTYYLGLTIRIVKPEGSKTLFTNNSLPAYNNLKLSVNTVAGTPDTYSIQFRTTPDWVEVDPLAYAANTASSRGITVTGSSVAGWTVNLAVPAVVQSGSTISPAGAKGGTEYYIQFNGKLVTSDLTFTSAPAGYTLTARKLSDTTLGGDRVLGFTVAGGITTGNITFTLAPNTTGNPKINTETGGLIITVVGFNP